MIDLLPNETVLYQWILFMIALFTLHFGIFRPVLKIISERKSRTIGEKRTAASLQRRAGEMTLLYEKKIEDAKALGHYKKSEKLLQAEKIRDELIKKTRDAITQRLDGIRHEMEREMKEISMQLRQYAQTLGREIASKIIEREII